VRRSDRGFTAIAGPDMACLRGDVEHHGRDFRTVGEWIAREGESRSFDLTWHSSTAPRPEELDAAEALRSTLDFWREWASTCTGAGRHGEAVMRSLVTLKGLTYEPTGGIVAAPTTSLPERIGGVRNWDYRFCWLRDATFTLYALMLAGHAEEARAWREWLLRAVAGLPAQMQIMYGLGGERRLTETELPWLPGYEGSVPVRVGNGAYGQFQLDVYGEVMDALHQCRRLGLPPSPETWDVQRALLEFLESGWSRPDEGIWEVRGPRRHFTHSKVMAWVAFDRAVKSVEAFGADGPVQRWRARRDEIHEQVCREGWDGAQGSFVQSYGSRRLDASLLMIPLVGFLPAADPRVQGTIRAVEKGLSREGFLLRYESDESVDGLPPGEGAFLLCTFWLADCHALSGRRAEAQATFDRILGIRNDVGLLSESYDPRTKRLLGNMPQAFSHVGLVNTALNLEPAEPGPAEERRRT
jgi:GH15 family glucan-1,4-alpha-glucosidase